MRSQKGMFCLLERESALSENRLLVSLLARARELAIPLVDSWCRRSDEDMIRIHEPVATNHPPGGLATLNLIDKVELQSGSE